MSMGILITRVGALIIAVTAPMGVLGGAAWGVQGACVLVFITLMLLMTAAGFSERWVLSVYQAKSESPEGVRRSLERVLESMGGSSPRIQVSADLAVFALVVRSVGSPGTILLSEGILGTLTEEDLRQLLSLSVVRLRSRGMILQALCACLAHLTLSIAPQAWVNLLYGELRSHTQLQPLSALVFASLYSVARFFSWLGRMRPTLEIDAPRSFVSLSGHPVVMINPGTRTLHLSDPWERRALLPL